MQLPYDTDLQVPESLIEWIDSQDVVLDIREIEGYPQRPLIFSSYQYEPPTITIYRYLPMEDWLNLMSQQQVGYYGPWYYLHVAYRFYFYLEMNGLFEIERKWYHILFGLLNTIEKRANRFVQDMLQTQHSPDRFDKSVVRSFIPGVTQFT